MSEELLPGSQIPTVTLTGDAARAYVTQLATAIQRARLNNFYPDARRLAAHVRAMAKGLQSGLYHDVRVDSRSGLPSYRDFTRVQTDVTIAHDQLHQLGPRSELARKASQRTGDVWNRQLAKHDYYTAIADTPLVPLGDMEVALRRHDTTRRASAFHVVLDKLDVSGLFVRYTIDLEQLGVAEHIRVDERDVAEQSQPFRGLLYKFTSLDAEFTFVKLAAIGELRPERVTKGLVGPIWTAATPDPPDDLMPILSDGGFVASFGFDIAAIDVAEQRNNDPYGTLAQDRLTPNELRSYATTRQRFGYQVFKDRKFVVPREHLDVMRAVCDRHGTKNIIYGI